MNWLQKISKVIDAKDIPYQISAAVNALLGKGEWNAFPRRRDWSAELPDRAVFSSIVQGKNIRDHDFTNSWREVKIHFFFTLPFNKDTNNPTTYDSATGLEGLMINPSIVVSHFDGGSKKSGDRIYGELMRTPAEVAQWAVDVINGEWRGDNNDNGNDNDESPPWSDSDPSGVAVRQEEAVLV